MLTGFSRQAYAYKSRRMLTSPGVCLQVQAYAYKLFPLVEGR